MKSPERCTILALAVVLMVMATTTAATQATKTVIRLAVTGESNLKTDFIEALQSAAAAEKIGVEVVGRTEPGLKYTLIIAQETTVGSAAAAVIGLDASGDVAFSVVRSGRFSGKGALNACAKEIAKKLAVLHRSN